MQINSESCVFVEDDDMVYGDQGYANTSQWHEAVYYSSPLDMFDNEAGVSYPNGDVSTYNSTYYQDPNLSGQYSYYGAPQLSSLSGGYVFESQALSYDYGTYHYEYYPVYYVFPAYLVNYLLTNLQYTPESSYYDYGPVNLYYYVPTFIYYTPTFAYNVSDVTYYDDLAQSYQSHEMSFPMEQNLEDTQEFNYNLYNVEKGSSTDTLDSCKEIVGEGITTCELFYDEYPQTLNDAPVDDEAKSASSSEKLENDGVSNEAEVNENIADYEESYSIETSHCEDDVDMKLIKKISSMSIEDVKEDIDVNYENAKAFVYNEVLKGYTEIKNQLEDLEWECHSLEDILEEEEPESDSSEKDFNENVAEDLDSIALLPVEEEDCSSAFVPLSEESVVASSEEALDKDYETMMDVTQPSVYLSVVEEKDKTDPFIELSSSEESKVASSEEALDKDYETMMAEAQPSVDLPVVKEKDKTDPFIELSLSEESKVASSEEALDKDYEIMMEEAQPSVDLSVVKEKDKTDPFIELSLSEESKVASSEEALDKDYETMMKEAQPSVDKSVVEEKDKTRTIFELLELSSSEEQLYTGSFSSNEDHLSPVDSSTLEEKDKIGPFIDLDLSKEELYIGSLNSNEDDCAPVNSSAVEENDTMDSVQELSLREEKSDSESRIRIKEPDKKMSSQERLNSDPDIVAPAASKEIQRKKRFSGLRKFLARMCCCVKKRS